MEAQPIPEIVVLIAVAKWLYSEGWQIKRVSMARGQKIGQASQEQKLKSDFISVGIPLETLKLIPQGPDIEAVSGTDVWKIECKGLGDVRLQTLKNNFDRAVASVVSYYDQRAGLRLGLAFPEEYIKLIRNKLPRVLREAISLWMFLYVSSDDEIYVFRPGEEIP